MIIQTKQLSFSLSGNSGITNILHNISINIQKNKRIALVGPSGSGKTSLLMIIAGLEKPSSGEIWVNGENITTLSEDALAAFRARHIGIVFQSFHLMPTLTALENAALPLEFSGDAQARAKAEEALARLGLAHRLHHYPSQMSGGEQQRVAIARAFVVRPALLLADEPTGNLDHETGEEVIRLLFDLQQTHGTTLLMVTHDMQLAARCDEILHINDGRITPHG